jgi:uncharacterized protein (TIGR03435 family)
VKSLFAFLLALTTVAAAQTPRPTFEVASIKKRDPSVPFIPTRTSPPPPRSTVFNRPNATVASLILFAYDLRAFQLVGGPDWISHDTFEISARAPVEVTSDEMRPMVRSLLEDRFDLVVRKEQRQMRYQALVIARSDGRLGPKLTQCGGSPKPVRIPRGGLVMRGCSSVSAIRNAASGILRTPVIDKTGLAGMWHHELVFLDPEISAPSQTAGSQPPIIEPDLVSFSTALQEQLGLRLEPAEGPVDVVVIESVQLPTEN